MPNQNETFNVVIQNLEEIKAAFAKAPQITEEEMQKKIDSVPEYLAKYTIPGIVPYKTGQLIGNVGFYHWGREVGRLTARWFPTAPYAKYVEDGTRPHWIESDGTTMLKFSIGGKIFFRDHVFHPGTKPNPYMERITDRATSDINQQFGLALDRVADRIAQSGK